MGFASLVLPSRDTSGTYPASSTSSGMAVPVGVPSYRRATLRALVDVFGTGGSAVVHRWKI